MIFYGEPPELTALWFPLIFAVHFIFTLGLSLPLAALNLFFHDVRFLVGVALNLWFYLTPVLYPADIIPDKYRFIIDINPNAVFIHAYRRVIIHGDDPGLDRILGGLIISVVVFLVGYYAFKKMEPGFADSI
jgi:ABC-type polysaccharide/polyol phosphate export permease